MKKYFLFSFLNEEIFLPVYFNILRIKIIKNEIMKLEKEIEENVT